MNKVHREYKKFEHNTKDYDNKSFMICCNFIADDTYKEQRVYFAESMGLNHSESKVCHVNLSLYYETHMAMTIPFASHNDAKEFVLSQGKIDKRIIKKTSNSKGWKLELKVA